MTEIKIFKIEQRFKGVEDLYKYLMGNVALINELAEIQIQKPLRARPFCITAKEKITERNILFFASKSKFPENLGELIVLASIFDINIIVFFLPNISKTYIESIKWLQKICNADTEFIIGKISF